MNDLAAVDTKPALPQCVINCVVYDKGGKRRDIGLDEISDVLAVDDGSFIWVGLYEPADAILEKLQEEFCLHDLVLLTNAREDRRLQEEPRLDERRAGLDGDVVGQSAKHRLHALELGDAV